MVENKNVDMYFREMALIESHVEALNIRLDMKGLKYDCRKKEKKHVEFPKRNFNMLC